MQPPTTTPHKRGLAERAALISLVGLSVLSVIGVGVVTIYLNRLTSSAEAMSRTVDMPDYLGRPGAVTAASGGSVMNVLILVDNNGSLDSAVVANLSASRRNLTLITVPSQLRLSSTTQETLGSSYAIDPSITVLAMEGLTGARMDHAVHLDLSCLGSVIDRTGGIQLSGVLMNGPEAIRTTQDTADNRSSAVGSARLIRSALIGMERHYASIDPSRFASMVDLAGPCLKVDNELTSQVVQNIFYESSIHPDETHIWPLETTATSDGLEPSATSLEQLRAAMASPELPSTEQYQQASFLPQESGR